MEKLKVFISSKMAELRDVRELVAKALDDRGIEAWVYEAHAGARPEDVIETSLSEVESADIYVGLFWEKYGEITVEEYRYARELGKPCFVYIRDKNIQREEALDDFLRAEIYDLQKGVAYDYFDGALELSEQVADDIMAWLVRRHRKMTAEIQAARVFREEVARLRAEVARLQAASRERLPQGTPADMAKTKQVFISHATKDAQFAHRLADDLQRLGVRVWIAPESIHPGESWVGAIECGLAESSHVVVVLTPTALESKWVRKETEVTIALERKGRIQVIPLDVKPCKVPLLLSSYQMVSFRRDYDAGLSQLATILDVRTTPMERHQPFEPEIILIPAGEFLMGSNPTKDKYAQEAEQPQHTLYLPSYYLAKTPVTNAQYAAFIQATNHDQPRHWKGGKLPSGKEDHPVVNITWYEAMTYCRWLSEVTGKPYCLPSEAEWEKGARGSDGRIYPWGNRWNTERFNADNVDKGWLDILSRDTPPVGTYLEEASPYGLLDMVGNVWEWTRSLWGRDWEEPDFKYPYNPGDGRENLKASDVVLRVLWGGSSRDGSIRCASRELDSPNEFNRDYGFRVVVSTGQSLFSGGAASQS